MSYKIPNFNLPDFSALTETARRIEEVMQPVRDSLQRISEVIQPVIMALESYKPKIEAGMQAFAKAMRNMEAVRKMADAQFVCWDYMSVDLAEQLVSTNNTNKTLREFLIKENFKVVVVNDGSTSTESVDIFKNIHKDTIFLKENSDLQDRYDTLMKLKDEYPKCEELYEELYVVKKGLEGENEIKYQLSKSNLGL